MQSTIEWTKTNRGATAFIYQNQKYRKRCTNKDGSEIWICCNKSCGVSMVLFNGVIKRYPQQHSHNELQHTPDVRAVLEKIYTETTTDLLKPVTEIYRQHLVQYKRKKGTAEDILVFNYIRSTAYRRCSCVLPPIPKSLEDIIIPDSLKFLENGDQFVIFDNPAPHRLITLCSPQALVSLGFIPSFRDTEARRDLANLFCLPLIPIEYVFSIYENIASQLVLKIADIEKLLQYFSNTYLYGTIFPPPRWNHFSFIGFTNRTTNAIEGFHRAINTRSTPHPNIWKHILLKRELDEQTMISISQEIKQKRPTKTKRKCYRDYDNRLIEAKELLINRVIDLLEYQRRVRAFSYRYIQYHEENEDDSDRDNDV
ncbi:unnamed protein product [Rotaria sordida]|uniref:FLYWCH-type domain-containing protein n=1 Tax=Rotaria sordida TaxID=392033 RepID=A0A814V0I0_9BILA|nr:unnamed protein product [Rotaria sordida]CAF1197799.1 unnamed protein product [Rotaria sordida]CAF1213983.1 unnamed protein product [Rotaria sordida]CAF1257297.1 unnamed protein product [Rotaria sordida]CAF1468056.1 unnamed protein product [Rotaria sordida]